MWKCICMWKCIILVMHEVRMHELEEYKCWFKCFSSHLAESEIVCNQVQFFLTLFILQSFKYKDIAMDKEI